MRSWIRAHIQTLLLSFLGAVVIGVLILTGIFITKNNAPADQLIEQNSPVSPEIADQTEEVIELIPANSVSKDFGIAVRRKENDSTYTIEIVMTYKAADPDQTFQAYAVKTGSVMPLGELLMDEEGSYVLEFAGRKDSSDHNEIQIFSAATKEMVMKGNFAKKLSL